MAYNPQGQDMVERFHRTLKMVIMVSEEGWLKSFTVLTGVMILSPSSPISGLSSRINLVCFGSLQTNKVN